MMHVHFVEMVPQADAINDGHLYISLTYNMTMHRCASGCGQLVPLPLSPADWSLTYDGETVSLSPSIGNGILACHSHYFIQNSQVTWASEMSVTEAKQQQAEDAALLDRHINTRLQQPLFKRMVSKLLKLIRG
jgi:hypothetical protein